MEKNDTVGQEVFSASIRTSEKDLTNTKERNSSSNKNGGKNKMAKIYEMRVGESLKGDGNEVAHID
ncbi:MAG: hypothetical protein ACU833_08125, partial [Gammaproteobacteria bacterium]